MKVKKKVYTITIEPSEKGKKYYNKYEDASYVGDGYRMVATGTRGEQWLIEPNKVASKYKNIGGNKYQTLPSSEILEAEDVPDGTKVKTSWGDILTAKNSKKVWPINNPNDTWLVDREIFKDTYQEI